MYIGQNGSNFKPRNKEHICDIRQNKENSKYSENLLDTQHGYGKAEDAMKIFKITSSGKNMDTWEQRGIYEFNKRGLAINEQYTNQHNTPSRNCTTKRKASTGEESRMLHVQVAAIKNCDTSKSVTEYG
jgi:hypothetical protein